jgi:hypothetical protein
MRGAGASLLWLLSGLLMAVLSGGLWLLLRPDAMGESGRLLALAETQINAIESPEARVVYLSALATYDRALEGGRDGVILDSAWRIAERAGARGDADAALLRALVAPYREALQGIPATPEPVLPDNRYTALLPQIEIQTKVLSGDIRGAEALAARPGDAGARVLAQLVLARDLWLAGQTWEARAVLERAFPEAKNIASAREQVYAVLSGAFIAHAIGRQADGRRLADYTLDLARESGDRERLFEAWLERARYCVAVGDLAEAQRVMELAEPHLSEYPAYAGLAASARALIAWKTSGLAGFRRALAEIPEADMRANTVFRALDAVLAARGALPPSPAGSIEGGSGAAPPPD